MLPFMDVKNTIIVSLALPKKAKQSHVAVHHLRLNIQLLTAVLVQNISLMILGKRSEAD